MSREFTFFTDSPLKGCCVVYYLQMSTLHEWKKQISFNLGLFLPRKIAIWLCWNWQIHNKNDYSLRIFCFFASFWDRQALRDERCKTATGEWIETYLGPQFCQRTGSVGGTELLWMSNWITSKHYSKIQIPIFKFVISYTQRWDTSLLLAWILFYNFGNLLDKVLNWYFT